jgi:hypothetical protein
MKKNTFIPPYTSVGEFVKFINSVRVRRPDPLTLKSLEEIGVGKSNAYTLFGTLKAMGLYDEKGRLLQRDELNGLASKDENIRRESFKKILERTYHDLMERVPVQEATVERVRHEFANNGAAPSIALKGARLVIWLANQAGFETAEVEFVPYNLEQEKTQKQKGHKKTTRPNGKANSASQLEFTPYVPKTAEEDEDRLLDSLQEKIRTTEGFPPVELVKLVQELIAAKKARNKAPEPLAGKENANA